MSKHNRSRSQEQSTADGQVQSGAPQGNRPANNARIATPGAISAPGWQGSAGADDFLGLNQDLANDPAAATPQSAPVATAPIQGSESWLFHAQDPEPEEVHVGGMEEEAPPSLPQEATWHEETPPARKLRPMLVKCAAAVVIGMFGFAAYKVVVASRGGKPVDVKPLEPDKLSITGGVEVSKPEPIESQRAGRKTTIKKNGSATPNEASSQSATGEVATVRKSIDPDTGAATPQSATTPEPSRASEPEPTQVSATRTVASAPEAPEEPATAPAPTVIEHVAAAPAQTSIARPQVGEPQSNAIPDPTPVEPLTKFEPIETRIASAPALPGASSTSDPVASSTVSPIASPIAGAASAGDPPLGAAAASPAANAAASGPSAAASWNGWTAMRSTMDPGVRAQSRWSHDNPGQDFASFSAALATQPDAPANAQAGDAGKPATPVAAARAEPAPPVDPAAEQKAKMKEIKGVWSDVEIPVDSIASPTKILTPNVGRVRAVIEGNEIFEGSLYAVGENTVWITSEYGRLGLSAARIVKLERLSSPNGTPVLGEKDSQNLTGLDKVRIRTPGGIFVGKIVAREGDQTIIVTEDGVRITLPTKDVELVGENPRLVIKPSPGSPSPRARSSRNRDRSVR
jgi:hypothetical protein